MIHRSTYKDIDIPNCNVLSYLFPSNEEQSDVPIWIDIENPKNNLSPRRMLSYIKRFSVGLNSLGVGKHEAVMTISPNHLYIPVAYLGAAGSRRPFTGANPAYTASEIAYQIQVSKPGLLLVHPKLLNNALDAAKMAQFPIERLFLFAKHEYPSQSGVRDWNAILAPEEVAMNWSWDDLENEASQVVATINFSSGTTGLPKGVSSSHFNIVANTAQTISVLLSDEGHFISRPWTPKGEKWLASLPLYHAFSQLFTINLACRLLIPVYIMENFSLSKFLRNIQTFRITTIQTVPPVLGMLAKLPEKDKILYDLGCLQNIMVGAAPRSYAVEALVKERYGVFNSSGWGMTETTCIGTLIPCNTKDTQASVGSLLPGTEAKIVDEEGNDIVDGPGELYLRGPQVMMGYWDNPLATRETLTEDGWVKTGDYVVVKHHKWWILDRKKELIKVNGLQVAPAEIEQLLMQDNEVVDAAVVGFENDGEEQPRAYIVLQKGNSVDVAKKKKQLTAFVSQKLAKHKRLTGGIQIVSGIPRLLSGKIKRAEVKSWAKEEAQVLAAQARAMSSRL